MKLSVAAIVISFMFHGTVTADEPEGTAEITYGFNQSPGVETHVHQYSLSAGGQDGSASDTPSTPGEQVPVPTGLIPHSCVPVSSGGIDLDFVFSPAGGADCASFISPAAPQSSE